MIQPIYHLLDKLLQGRLFEIPDYQRTYSWGKKQRNDLFSDIEKLRSYQSEPDRHHFMATVVCLATKTPRTIGADEFQIFKIVDGQQRLTTLIILLKEILLALNTKNKEEKKAKSDLDDLLVKSDRRIILLQTNHDSSNIFKNYLRDAKEPPAVSSVKTQGDLNLVNAISECRSFVMGWKKKKKVLELLRLVKNRLGFVLYILDDEAPVYTVFEVLNSRGLDVDSLDKCKSMLMGIAFEKCGKAKDNHIKELHENWKKIFQCVGKKLIATDEILRFTATLEDKNQPSETLSSEESLALFRAECEKSPNQVLAVAESLFNMAERLEELYKDPRREAVTKITHARLLATSISLADHLSVQERDELLLLWEKITFRIFGMFCRDARTKRGDFTKLAWAIKNNKPSKVSIAKELERIGSEFPIDVAITQLTRERNCYDGWGDELRYFLYRYEEHLVKEAGGAIDRPIWEAIWNNSAYSTIEHIFPQNPGQAWGGKIGRGRDTIINNVHRLGNLLLLPPGENSKASNKSFKEKKIIYKRFPMRLSRDVEKVSDWNKKAIDGREKALLSWAKKEWI
jgi:hypothetical protein